MRIHGQSEFQDNPVHIVQCDSETQCAAHLLHGLLHGVSRRCKQWLLTNVSGARSSPWPIDICPMHELCIPISQVCHSLGTSSIKCKTTSAVCLPLKAVECKLSCGKCSCVMVANLAYIACGMRLVGKHVTAIPTAAEVAFDYLQRQAYS